MSVLVNKQAPDFTAAAVLGDGSIVDAFQLSSLRGKYVVLFFWPLDFTFVCPSEIIAHNNRMDKFRELGVEVVGVSIDSQFTHHAWRSTPVTLVAKIARDCASLKTLFVNGVAPHLLAHLRRESGDVEIIANDFPVFTFLDCID